MSKRHWLAKKRAEKGFSQEKVARLANISNQAYIVIERGLTPNPTLRVMKAIAKALDFDPREWFEHEA